MRQANKKFTLLKLIPAGLYNGLIWQVSSKSLFINLSGFDKTAHILEYSLLGFLLSYGLNISKENFETNAKHCLIFGILAGIIDETHQYFVPGRSSDIIDLAADITGISAGILAWLIFNIIFKKYFVTGIVKILKDKFSSKSE